MRPLYLGSLYLEFQKGISGLDLHKAMQSQDFCEKSLLNEGTQV